MAAVDVAMGDTADVPEEASALMHVPPSPAVNPAHPVDQAPNHVLYRQEQSPETVPAAGSQSPTSSKGESSGPSCENCHTKTTSLWRRSADGGIMCNACSLYLKMKGTPRPVSLKSDVIKHRNRSKGDNSRRAQAEKTGRGRGKKATGLSGTKGQARSSSVASTRQSSPAMSNVPEDQSESSDTFSMSQSGGSNYRQADVGDLAAAAALAGAQHFSTRRSVSVDARRADQDAHASVHATSSFAAPTAYADGIKVRAEPSHIAAHQAANSMDQHKHVDAQPEHTLAGDTVVTKAGHDISENPHAQHPQATYSRTAAFGHAGSFGDWRTLSQLYSHAKEPPALPKPHSMWPTPSEYQRLPRMQNHHMASGVTNGQHSDPRHASSSVRYGDAATSSQHTSQQLEHAVPPAPVSSGDRSFGFSSMYHRSPSTDPYGDPLREAPAAPSSGLDQLFAAAGQRLSESGPGRTSAAHQTQSPAFHPYEKPPHRSSTRTGTDRGSSVSRRGFDTAESSFYGSRPESATSSGSLDNQSRTNGDSPPPLSLHASGSPHQSAQEDHAHMLVDPGPERQDYRAHALSQKPLALGDDRQTSAERRGRSTTRKLREGDMLAPGDEAMAHDLGALRMRDASQASSRSHSPVFSLVKTAELDDGIVRDTLTHRPVSDLRASASPSNTTLPSLSQSLTGSTRHSRSLSTHRSGSRHSGSLGSRGSRITAMRISGPSSPIGHTCTHTPDEVQRLQTRVQELELINSLMENRVSQLESKILTMNAPTPHGVNCGCRCSPRPFIMSSQVTRPLMPGSEPDPDARALIQRPIDRKKQKSLGRCCSDRQQDLHVVFLPHPSAVMLRRQTRLRREFLYKKEQEARLAATASRKKADKDAKADAVRSAKGKGKATEEAVEEDIDDEYSLAGIEDPKILLTTSRDPSSRLEQFAKEMRLVFPNATRLNRGATVMKELSEACRNNKFTDLVVLHEHRGQPDAMVVSHFPHGPTTMFTLHNVVLRHDIASHSTSTVSEQFPHLIFSGFSSKLGGRVRNILKYLFPVPKEDSKRVMTFSNEDDFISFRHHVFVRNSHTEVQLAEVGPRMQMRPYEIRQGTIEQTEADVEWVLRPYQRTARKRSQL